jgi:hypothetical protein
VLSLDRTSFLISYLLMLNIVLIFLSSLSLVLCANNDCRSSWNNQKQCIDRDRPQFTTTQLSDQERSDIKRKLRQCYLDERCADPFPSDREEQARSKCFQEVKDRYQKEMQDCVRRTYSDYDMPTGNDGNRQWGQYAVQMKSAKCQVQDKKRFGNCMANALQRVRGNGGGNRGNNNGGQQQQQRQNKPDPCEIRYQCYQKNMAQPCYNRQNDVKKELCNCAGKLNIDSYKNAYKSCMQRSNINVDGKNDFNLVSFDKIKDKFCKQTQDPCGGYNGRQALGGKNNNNQNGNNRGNNNNANPSSSSNRGWNNGFNGGSNGNNGFNGGNNGFNGGNNGFNGGNPGNPNFNGGNTGPNSNFNGGNSGNDESFNPGNYDFSSVGGDDDGFPSVGNVLSSGNSGSSFTNIAGGTPDLSSFISSSNTGFDPSSFLSGGTDTSGLGGGLLGSLGGSNILSAFTGGSGADATGGLLGLLGAGKKKK